MIDLTYCKLFTQLDLNIPSVLSMQLSKYPCHYISFWIEYLCFCNTVAWLKNGGIGQCSMNLSHSLFFFQNIMINKVKTVLLWKVVKILVKYDLALKRRQCTIVRKPVTNANDSYVTHTRSQHFQAVFERRLHCLSMVADCIQAENIDYHIVRWCHLLVNNCIRICLQVIWTGRFAE